MKTLDPLSVSKVEAEKRYDEIRKPKFNDEYWRFSSPEKFTSEKPLGQISKNKEEVIDFETSDCLRISFVDGCLNMKESNLGEFKDIEVFSMGSEEVKKVDWINDLYGSIEKESQKKLGRGLAAYNSAYAKEGVFIRVSGQLKQHIVIDYSSERGRSDALIHNLLRIEASASVTLIETGEGASRVNRMLECDILEHGECNHVRFFGANTSAHILAQCFVRQAFSSTYNQFSLTFENLFARNETSISLEGEGCMSSISAASIGVEGSSQDDTVYIAHMMPNCKSRQVFKKVLRDDAVGIFQGKIFVDPKSQKTDGYQISKGLLLNAASRFLTKPELEIYADDVICSHGSTCGDIDEDSLFYLMSRGIPKEQCISMLTLAFLDEALEEVVDDLLVQKIRGFLIKKLGIDFE
ncbi:MAG: SufD family Fe-S cluster assembly protein [Pseudomonadota bacterium]|nr:SufD family Fe-S cluster assembly protein [Pseudomonadota bacterium]